VGAGGRAVSMKIIQIAADKQLGYWYFDKQEKQLIKVSYDMMRQMDTINGSPFIHIAVISGCILAAIGAYLTRRGLYIETRNVWLFVGVSVVLSYVYATIRTRRFADEAKKSGCIYPFTAEVLRYVSQIEKKIYIISLLMLFVLIVITGLGLYFYPKEGDIRMAIVGVGGMGAIVMYLISLHPFQKLLFWIKVRKLY